MESWEKTWEAEKKTRLEAKPKNEVTGRLENWRWSPLEHVYWGNIYDDIRGRFFDGQYIHTSYVICAEGDIAHTLNSTYKLGKPENLLDINE